MDKAKNNMRDFTLTVYNDLLDLLRKRKYQFITFAEYMEAGPGKKKLIILRHDVDKKPLRSLRTAEIEKSLGIKGTYYFRVEGNKLAQKVIARIAELGHEIGYHYDDLNVADGILENAVVLFKKNLDRLREVTAVKTACMHGSPLSKYDNRHLWQKFDYHDFGIIGEPYFDINFNEVMYLTDTGRRWDGSKVNIRDRVSGVGREAMGDGEDRGQKTEDREDLGKGSRGAVADPPALRPHSTADIILALKNDMLPDKIMLTIHPQRWTDNYFFWLKEFFWQNVKNGVKYFVARSSSQ